MIFVTTGTQLPFPRLIAAIDRIAPDLNEEVVVQMGPDTTPRRNVICHATLAPAQFESFFQNARLVVAHAGIGSILSAKRWQRPLVIVPRRHALGEHRNDHQMATAREMEGRPGFRVVWDPEDLSAVLTAAAPPPPETGLSPSAGDLIARIRQFVDG